MRKRAKAITIRVTQEEAEQIRSKALEAGAGIAEYIIKQSIEGKVYCVSGVPDVVKELRAIGNNINQITRNTNVNCAVDLQELRGIRKELNKAWQLLRQLILVEKG